MEPTPITEQPLSPALILFNRILEALQQTKLPEVWHTELRERLLMLKPELPSDAFQCFATHLKSYSTATARLSKMEAEINDLLLGLVQVKLPEYSALQTLLDESAKDAEAIARANAEWFDAATAKKRTVVTPYGEASMHSSSSLSVKDGDQTLELLKCPKVQKAVAELLERPFDPMPFQRQSVELNLEALETLPDTVLCLLGVERVSKDNFKIKAASINMKTAVKDVTKKAAKEAKAGNGKAVEA